MSIQCQLKVHLIFTLKCCHVASRRRASTSTMAQMRSLRSRAAHAASMRAAVCSGGGGGGGSGASRSSPARRTSLISDDDVSVHMDASSDEDEDDVEVVVMDSIRPHAAPAASSASVSWSCAHCTYENTEDTDLCYVCVVRPPHVCFASQYNDVTMVGSA